MSQRLNLPLPDRCSLYQALLWVSDLVRPVNDYDFESLPHPATLGPTDEDKRELLLALMSGHLEAYGIFYGDEGHQNYKFEDQTVVVPPGLWKWEAVNWQESGLQAPDRSAAGEFIVITVRTSELMKVFPEPSEPAQGIIVTARTSSQQTKPEPEKSAVVGPSGSAAPRKRGAPGRPNQGVVSASVYLKIFPDGHDQLGHTWESALLEIANQGAPKISKRTLQRGLETLEQKKK